MLAGGLLLSGITVALIYAYQDKVIGLFVAEANKHLKTKVAVGQISLSWWDKFPQVSVTLRQVRITEGVPGSTAFARMASGPAAGAGSLQAAWRTGCGAAATAAAPRKSRRRRR